jgi:hypothetical protein
MRIYSHQVTCYGELMEKVTIVRDPRAKGEGLAPNGGSRCVEELAMVRADTLTHLTRLSQGHLRMTIGLRYGEVFKFVPRDTCQSLALQLLG